MLDRYMPIAQHVAIPHLSLSPPWPTAHSQLLATAISQVATSPMLEIAQSTTFIRLSVSAIADLVLKVAVLTNAGKIYSLESRVSFDALLNSEARYPPPKCHADTRKEAQKVVKNWLCRKGEGSEKGIMWMSGAPGVGKSAIAQTVCEDLCCDDGSKSWLTKIVYRDR